MGDTIYTSQVLTLPGGFSEGIEGPACDDRGNIYAVNYLRQGTIGKVTPDGECSVFISLPEGSIGNGIRFNRHGDMLIADYTRHNILIVDMSSLQLKIYAHDDDLHQPNDIAIRSDDVLFASDPNWDNSTGSLWCIGDDHRFIMLESDMGTTNGIEISPDEKTLYVNESIQRNIWAYDLSSQGEISNKRLLIHFEDYGLDGMRCDIDGNLYVTRYGKGCVAKISPSGVVLLEILLHGKNCTNLTFGGTNGCTCYVTVADQGNIEFFKVEKPGRCWVLRNISEQLINSTWKARFDVELTRAYQARANGNEGKARVCARRAAGIAVSEYLQRKGYVNLPSSAYNRLQFLLNLKDISPQIRTLANNLLMKITPEHILPVDVDLLKETEWLTEELLSL